MSTTPTPEQQVEHLLRSLTLQPRSGGRYHARVYQDEGRLFGGLVLAQSVMAAGATVGEETIHSLHGYFLRAGKPAVNIDYEVVSIREGRNFKTRRVTAHQADDIIYEAMISFTRQEPGITHQAPMPDVPEPDGLPGYFEMLMQSHHFAEGTRRRRWHNPIDIRACDGPPRPPSEMLPRRRVWAKPVAPLPESPLIHAAVMAYMTDSGMVGTVGAAYGAWAPGGASASLDHAIWWHRPPRFDDWLLYITESHAAHAARALTNGTVFNREGQLVASVAQEALFRQPAAEGKKS